MSNSERLSQILDYLKKHRSASVEEIANMLYVSVATVRRDLTELQKRGQINRSRGRSGIHRTQAFAGISNDLHR